MMKYDLVIGDETIQLADEMTLGQYQTIYSNPERYKNKLQLISLFTGISVMELKNQSPDTIDMLEMVIGDRFTIPEMKQIVLTFTHKNVEYGLEMDWSKLAFGAWVDFEVYSSENIYQNLHKIMAILYRPIQSWDKKREKYKLVPYKAEEIDERSEVMKIVPVKYWISAAVFFFNSRRNIHRQYQEFFGTNPDELPESDDGDTEAPEMDTKTTTARFYFTLIYQLAKEDITKYSEITNMNLYLCLNTASLMKEKYEREKEEIEKMKKGSQIKNY